MSRVQRYVKNSNRSKLHSLSEDHIQFWEHLLPFSLESFIFSLTFLKIWRLKYKQPHSFTYSSPNTVSHQIKEDNDGRDMHGGDVCKLLIRKPEKKGPHEGSSCIWVNITMDGWKL